MFLLAGSIFITSSEFVNSENTPKYYFFLLMVWGISIHLLFRKQLLIPKSLLILFCLTIPAICLVITNLSNVSSLLSIASIILFAIFCFQVDYLNKIKQFLVAIFFIGIILASYGLLQYIEWLPSIYQKFSVIGFFENPAGFSATLALIYPIGLFLLLSKNKERYHKFFLGIGLLLFVLSIALSGSRTGIISVIASSSILLFLQTKLFVLIKKISYWKWLVPIILFTVLVLSVVALYPININSSNGRLLIWRVSSDMILDKPFLGHGEGAFMADYMDYQAEYLTRFPESQFRQLADNVKHPFNEFILILIEYGIIGFVVFLALLFTLCRKIGETENEVKHLFFSGLLGFLTFSFFSYPLKYVSVWILLIIYLSLSINTKSIEIKNRLALVGGKMVVFTLLVFCTYLTLNKIRTEIKWNNIIQNSLKGKTTAMLSEYKEVYSELRNNPYFLYNYGAELNIAQKYNKSIVILKECEAIFNDYDVQLILAKNYEKIGNFKKAEKKYKHASKMIPARFWPLYKLVKIYREQDKTEDAVRVAKIILNKKAKIPSLTISSIKHEMKRFLDEFNITY
jgi:O-antigen ligase